MNDKMILSAEKLKNDPRIAEAKRLILEAVSTHQEEIQSICPQREELKESYNQILSEYAAIRGHTLYFPYIASGLGKGALVELMDGSVKYDFISGIGPFNFGHSHLDTISACIDAALADTVMQGNLQSNILPFKFSQLMTKISKMDHCFLTTSGAMANENGLKLAFQKNFPKDRILVFNKCFAGRTFILSQMTDKPAYREGLSCNYPIDYVPFYDEKNPEESTQNAVNVLKKHLLRYPNRHAVMVFEFIQGEGGFNVGTTEFFKSLMDILKEHRVAIFADEIQTFGRLEEPFAFQYFGLEDYIDIVAFGKVTQVCGTLFTKEYNPQPGLLSQTFIASTSAIEAGYCMVEHMLNDGFFGPKGKIASISNKFKEKLESLSKKYPDKVNGPFGLGSMLAFTPYDGDEQKVKRFIQNLYQAGVMSFIAGDHPSRVRFLIPSAVITEDDITKAFQIIEKTLLESS